MSPLKGLISILTRLYPALPHWAEEVASRLAAGLRSGVDCEIDRRARQKLATLIDGGVCRLARNVRFFPG